MAALVQRIRARAASLPTFDIPFLLILLLLLSYGLIMLFSAGYAVALYRRGDAYTYIRPQLLFAALGVLVLSGETTLDVADKADPQPHITADSIEVLGELIREANR